jgi:hypothetical protein
MFRITSTFDLVRSLWERAHRIYCGMTLKVELIAKHGFITYIRAPRLRYKMECFGPDGNLKWVENFTNIVFDVGINDLLDKYFAGAAYTAAWFMGLVDNGSFSAFAAADTAASHAGWLEFQNYVSATRPAVTWSGAAAKSKAASAACSFAINGAGGTVNGAFLSTLNTKGGTTGINYSAGSFAANRVVSNGDTINVTPTVTGA